MTSDGEHSEQRARRRYRPSLGSVGVRFTVTGAVTTLLCLLLDYRELLTFAVVWTTIGVVMLVLDLLAAKRAAGGKCRSGSAGSEKTV